MFGKKKEEDQLLYKVGYIDEVSDEKETVIERNQKKKRQKSKEKTKEIQKKKVNRKKDKVVNEMKYVIPTTLRKSIEDYGYRMNVKNFIMCHIAAILAILGSAYIFRLKIPYVIFLIIEIVVCIPMFVNDKYKRQYYADEFENATKYVESMLYAFNKTGKIKDSLAETLKVFPKGNMHECIERALQSINNGEFYDISRKNLYVTALEYIEEAYPSKRIVNAHRLMTTTEMDGGEYHAIVKVLMNDRRAWEENTKKMMNQKSVKFNELVISAVTSGAIAALTTLVYKTLPDELNITTAYITQFASFFMLFALIVIVKIGSSKWTTDWVKIDALEVDENALEDYEYVLNFDDASERKKSIILSIPFFLIAAVLFMRTNIGIADLVGLMGVRMKLVVPILFAAVGVLCLFLPRLIYRAYYKSVVKNIKLSFPTWLLQLSNLLQENNVVNALQKSKETAPSLLIPEIDDLLTRISERPGDVETYTDFFGYFKINEIRSTMQALYTIAESGNDDIEEQMQTLIDTNYYLQQQAEEITAENVILAMKNMFQIPMVIVSMKLIADLLAFVIVAFPALANMSLQ